MVPGMVAARRSHGGAAACRSRPRQRRLVAVAPLYCTTGPLQPVRYRFLGTETCPRVEPVTQPGMEARAAAQIVSALTRARPRPDVVEFDGVPSSSPWPRLIADHWPGRAVATTTQSVAAPAATLAVDFEQWLNGKSRNFRKQTRRHRRALVERGASFRVAPADECDKALADFERLHQERFRYRGGSGVLDTQVMKMLRESAASLAASGRFRLHLLEHKQRVIGAELVLAAGGEVTSWLGGFDERWAKVQPSIQGLVAAIEHAVADNDTRFDLGPGTQPYKLRLSDHAEQLIWSRIFMPGPRRPLTRIITVPGHVSRAAKQKLFDVVPTAHKHQINGGCGHCAEVASADGR